MDTIKSRSPVGGMPVAWHVQECDGGGVADVSLQHRERRRWLDGDHMPCAGVEQHVDDSASAAADLRHSLSGNLPEWQQGFHDVG